MDESIQTGEDCVTLTVVNSTSASISTLYFTLSGVEDWGANLLGGDRESIEPGDFFTVSNLSVGKYDCQALNCRGVALYENYDIDLRDMSSTLSIRDKQHMMRRIPLFLSFFPVVFYIVYVLAGNRFRPLLLGIVMIPLFINVPIFMLEDRRRSAPTEIQARKYDNLAITGLVLSGFGIMAFAVLGIFNRVFYLILRSFEINALLSNILSLSPVLAALLTNFLGYSICTYVIWMNITKRKGNTRVLVLSGIGVLISLCLFSAIAFVMYFSLQMISYW